MGTLHTVNKSPFATPALQSCIAHARDGDTILMIEDGVYGATAGTTVADLVSARAGNVAFFVLAPDCAARGLDAGRMVDAISPVDYDGFVDLAAKSDRVQAWL